MMKYKSSIKYLAILVLILYMNYDINFSLISMIGVIIGSSIAIFFKTYDDLFSTLSIKLKNNILSIFKNFVIPMAMTIALLYNTKSSLELLSDSIFSYMAYYFLLFFWEKSDEIIMNKKSDAENC